MDTPDGGVDTYQLREDAKEENKGYCECYYKKIGRDCIIIFHHFNKVFIEHISAFTAGRQPSVGRQQLPQHLKKVKNIFRLFF